MTSEVFGLGFAGKAAALAELDAPPGIDVVFDPEQSINPDIAEHVFIEGDNLEVLRRIRRAYEGRVSMVYIDPPYNTGHDFIYRDDYGVDRRAFLRQTGQIDADAVPLVTNPSTAGRFHSAWLSMMYPRLWMCRRLLRDDGIFMCSIDDHEVHRLRMLLDEIFGEDCFIAQVVVVTNRGGRDYLRIATGHEYILVYGASPSAPIAELTRPRQGTLADARGGFELRELRNRNPKFHPGNRPNLHYPIFVDPRPDADGLCAVSLQPTSTASVAVEPVNREGRGSVWRWGKDKLARAIDCGDAPCDVVARQRRDGGFNIYEKYRKTTRRPRALWDDAAYRTECGSAELRRLLGETVFDHPKPVALVRRCIELGCPPDGIVLDAFAGSGTTVQAVVEQNAADGGRRRALAIQVAQPSPSSSSAYARGLETIPQVAAARLMAVWSEMQEGGIRWFRTRMRAPALVVEAGEGGDAYWEALLEHEAARKADGIDRFNAALDEGWSLDASIRCEGRWWIMRERGRDRCLVGLVDTELEALPAWPSVPPGSTIVLPDAWIERAATTADADRFRLVGYRAHPV